MKLVKDALDAAAREFKVLELTIRQSTVNSLSTL